MTEKIERFAQQMRFEIENNMHKGDISDWRSINNKIADFEYHKAKMMLAIRMRDKIALKEYIADCANILLSIGDEFGLYNNETLRSNTCTQLKQEIFERVDIDDQKVENIISQR